MNQLAHSHNPRKDCSPSVAGVVTAKRETESRPDLPPVDDFARLCLEQRATEALRLLRTHVSRPLRILAVGRAGAEMAEAMEGLGHIVFAGSDEKADAITARGRIGARAAVTDLARLPFAPGSFDAVVMLGVISETERPRAILDAARVVLRPGGLLILSAVIEAPLFDRWSALIAPRQEPSGEGVAGAFPDLRDFEQLVAGRGFEPISWAAVDFGRLRLFGKGLCPPRLTLAIARLMTILSRRPPLRLLVHHARIPVVCFRKVVLHKPSARRGKRERNQVNRQPLFRSVRRRPAFGIS